MEPSEVRTAADARRIVEERGLSHVKVGLFDIDGIMRGKYMSRQKFLSALEKGFGFCDVVLGWDADDQLYDNTRYTGWHTGYPDAPVRILPASCRELPFEPGMLLFLAEFDEAVDTPAPCPRRALRQVLRRAQEMGFGVLAGFEYEYFLFEETPDSVRAKHYRDLQPLAPGFFGYSVLRNSVHAEHYRETLDFCEQMRLPLEGLHEETGPGVLEAALAVADALEAADRAALFKTFAKVHAQRNGRMATFMAKWSPKYPGQSGHIHISLRGRDSAPVFHDPDGTQGMSTLMRHFVAGQQALMPELLALVAGTVNAYTRLVPGMWAPTHASWGIDNRTCALRVIPGPAASQRVEYRLAGADANPYLALAAAIGSGLIGIERELEPTEPLRGNAYEQSLPQEAALPATLWEAAQRLQASPAARTLFGDDFIDHYAATREWEERQYRRAITDWELARYFEII